MGTVLIIDPDERFTESFSSHFSTQGLEVVIARSGEEGMSQALKIRPDVILMDAIMPDVTGLQMCSRFRQTVETQTIPIVLMSALARFANQQRFALERGASEFIAKPARVIELGEIVDKYIAPKNPEKSDNSHVLTDIHVALDDALRRAIEMQKEIDQKQSDPDPNKSD